MDFWLLRCLDFGWPFGLSFPLGFLLPPHRLPTLYLPCTHASRRICMNAPSATSILIECVRQVARSLRGLANSLERAADRAEGLPGPQPTPSISSDTVDTVEWDLITQLDALSGHPVSSSGPTRSLAASYHEVASSIPPLPDHCLDLCRRLGGTAADVKSRALRAWEAGHWAKATWEERVPKPRPTSKLALQNTVYIILKGPNISRPVRVSSAAEYYKLLPKFEDSISHAFPSISEGKVYCLAAGVAFPDPPETSQ